MKDTTRRDSLLMIVGTGALSIAFLLGIFMPGTRKAAAIEREIAEAEQALRGIPLEIAQRESLRRTVASREESLREYAPAVPDRAEIPSVIRQVAQLAADARLKVTRLEPLAPIDHASYREFPVRVTLLGPFAGIAGFLHGLETQPRLFRFGDSTLKAGDRQDSGTTEADVYFSVYAVRAENADSAENGESSAAASSDRNRE